MNTTEAADLARTRALLEQREAENVRLARELEATGLTDFCDRVDWLMAFWPADRRLAWDRHWASWGVEDSAPFQSRPRIVDPRPTGERKYQPRKTFTSREFEIATAALAVREGKVA